jgi:hypothetical protein
VLESAAPVFESVDEQRAQKGGMYWMVRRMKLAWTLRFRSDGAQYIKGMLSNLGPQNIETMQRMLALVKDYDQTVDELAVFLAAAKREGQVEQRADGTWQLL